MAGATFWYTPSPSMVDEGETEHTAFAPNSASCSSPTLESWPTRDARMRRGGVNFSRACCTVALSRMRASPGCHGTTTCSLCMKVLTSWSAAFASESRGEPSPKMMAFTGRIGPSVCPSPRAELVSSSATATSSSTLLKVLSAAVKKTSRPERLSCRSAGIALVTVRSIPSGSQVQVEPSARKATSAASRDSTRKAFFHDFPRAEEGSVIGGMMRTYRTPCSRRRSATIGCRALRYAAAR
mmetsp:Transcript_51241/g.133051  ORF Transcript_51241/g.133051 Transcript_51241/m.133051 type:complete len:240 (-) Transcript_51241:574-1293(-)